MSTSTYFTGLRQSLQWAQRIPSLSLGLIFGATGVDFIAIVSFVKLVNLAKQEGMTLVPADPVCDLLEEVEA